MLRGKVDSDEAKAVLPVLALAHQARNAGGPDGPPMPSSAAVVSALEPAANDFLPPIHFAAGITQIRPRDTKILDAHALWLLGDRNRVLLIEGHTDGERSRIAS